MHIRYAENEKTFETSQRLVIRPIRCQWQGIPVPRNFCSSN